MNIKLQINNKNIKINNQTKEMDVAPFLQSNRTFVPIRFIAESFGYKVDWNEKDEIVIISNEKENNSNSIDEAALYWAM